MTRLPLALMLAVSPLLVAGCASIPPAGPTRFFVSYSGESPPTRPLFDQVDARMRVEPGFVRDFDQPMQIHIADGVPASAGRLRYRVRISIPARLHDRRVREKDRTLAEFVVACAPERPEPCADQIIVRARLQPTKIGRILARSPQA